MIDSFHGQYRFLSNFWPTKVTLDCEDYPTVEHAYQASKTISLIERIKIRLAKTPGEAKKLGKQVCLRPNFDKLKLEIMKDLLRQKFLIPELRLKLINTGTQELIEGNYWNDTYWGICNGKGQNHLGKLLMEVRQELHQL